MRNNIILPLVAIALAVALGAILATNIHKAKQARQEMQADLDSIAAIASRKDKILDLDSIETAISLKIIDTLTTLVGNQEDKIAALQKQIQINRRENEKLEKRFNDIVISMPEF